MRTLQIAGTGLAALCALMDPVPGAAPIPRDSAGPMIAQLQITGERWTCEADGRPLAGILVRPEGPGLFPAILISHGLGGSAESFGLDKAREFAKWGMVCIAPNYTHAGPTDPSRTREPRDPAGARPARERGRGGAHPPDFGASEENILRARAAIEIVRGLGCVDAGRIAAYGHSMGGFVTIGLAAAAPGLLSTAAVTGSGLAPRAGFPAPSVQVASRIRAPFLILHGGADPVVRSEQSAMLSEALRRAGTPNERRVFDGEGHPIDRTRRAQVLGAMREWFIRTGVLKP